jgi:hypothetical protein
MRTTLTLDDDVASVLERLRKSRNASLKDLVNEALRRGLRDMCSRTRRERLRTRPVALGRPRISGLDNIGEALALTEGEAHK